MSLTVTLSQAVERATLTGLDPLDAERLLLHALGHPCTGRAWLRAHDTDFLPEYVRQLFDQLCTRRLANEPLAYITGQRGFYGLDLRVDSRVLDPRPDTETLVDWARDVMRLTQQPRVVDLGTGSGAIALAIQHERADAKVLAVDASADALAVASAKSQTQKIPFKLIQC